MPTIVDVHSGDVWLSGSGHVNVLPNERLKLTITNTSTHGHLAVTYLVLGAESTMFLESWIDPTAGLPTTVKRIDNAILDGRSYVGDAVVKADVGPGGFSGGVRTDTGIVVSPSGLATPFEFHVPEGHTFGFQTVPRPGNNTVSVGFSFTELD